MVALGSRAGPVHLLKSRDWRGQVAPTEFVVWAAFLQSGCEVGRHCAITGAMSLESKTPGFLPRTFPMEFIISFFMQQTCLNAH